jgi:hypothetical protein
MEKRKLFFWQLFIAYASEGAAVPFLSAVS